MNDMTRHFLLSIVTLGLIVGIAKATAPSEYFGGLDNEAYLQWASSATTYTQSSFLDSTGNVDEGVAVHWTLDSTHIYLAVAARAIGWVGFGIAESGGMRGADIVLFDAATKTLTDSHVLDDLVTPTKDDCQDWQLISSQSDGGFLIFEARRLIDTGDSTQDRAIIDDSFLDVPPHRVIAAWGNTTTVRYHGANNRARGNIRFYGEQAGDQDVLFERQVESLSESSFIIRVQDFLIPTTDTHYEQTCFSSSDLVALGVPIDQDLHTIGMMPVVDSRATEFVHHFVVYASTEDACQGDDTFFPEVTFIWAPGESPLVLPPDVGGLLGVNGYKAFILEIHYNNPSLISDVLDSSGVQFFYTSSKRKYDLGVLQLGDPFVSLRSAQIGDGFSQHTFDCPSSCSQLALKENVIVLSELLHMHKLGKRMYNTQMRNGEAIRTGNVDYFDFDQVGAFAVVQPPFEIMPGDSFQTTCYYEDASKNATFGLSSQNEMCIAYLFYYPRQLLSEDFPYVCAKSVGEYFNVTECDSAWTPNLLTNEDELGRAFGVESNASCAPLDTISTTNAPTISSGKSAAQQQQYSGSIVLMGVCAIVGMFAL